MAVETNCPQCGAVYWFTSDLTGTEVKCDECATTFVVSRSNSDTNDGGSPEEGIKAAGDRIQSKPPSPRPRFVDEDERHTRQPIKKSPGCSIFPILLILGGLLLLGGGSVIVSILATMGGDSKEMSAKIGVQTIEDATTDFYQTYGRWPATIEELVEPQNGKPAKLDPKALIDPWGQPYQYELKNLDPKTQKPRVWSSGEPGQRRPISNW